MQFFIIFKNLAALGMPRFDVEAETVLPDADVFF